MSYEPTTCSCGGRHAPETCPLSQPQQRVQHNPYGGFTPASSAPAPTPQPMQPVQQPPTGGAPNVLTIQQQQHQQNHNQARAQAMAWQYQQQQQRQMAPPPPSGYGGGNQYSDYASQYPPLPSSSTVQHQSSHHPYQLQHQMPHPHPQQHQHQHQQNQQQHQHQHPQPQPPPSRASPYGGYPGGYTASDGPYQQWQQQPTQPTQPTEPLPSPASTTTPSPSSISATQGAAKQPTTLDASAPSFIPKLATGSNSAPKKYMPITSVTSVLNKEPHQGLVPDCQRQQGTVIKGQLSERQQAVLNKDEHYGEIVSYDGSKGFVECPAVRSVFDCQVLVAGAQCKFQNPAPGMRVAFGLSKRKWPVASLVSLDEGGSAVQKGQNPWEMDVVFFHALCWDGLCAAYSFYNAAGSHRKKITFVPVTSNHEDDIPETEDKNIAILDMVFPPARMTEIVNGAASAVIIDHHVSSEDYLTKGSIPPHMVRFDVRYSAAELSWEYCKVATRFAPKWVQIFSRHPEFEEYPPLTLLRAGSSAQNTAKMLVRLNALVNEGDTIVQKILQIGEEAETALEDQVEEWMLECEIKRFSKKPDITVAVVNLQQAETAKSPRGTIPYKFARNELGHRLSRVEGVSFGVVIAGKAVMLRCDNTGDFNVNDLASLYGGGGHATAAAFQLESEDDSPFV